MLAMEAVWGRVQVSILPELSRKFAMRQRSHGKKGIVFLVASGVRTYNLSSFQTISQQYAHHIHDEW
jgi:hypothetical protein